jgi:ArsR family transcriptional regulator
MEEFLKPFKALSDETRLRMLNILTAQECCVCEVMQVLGISQTRASRNLKILEEAGFLQARRDGTWVYYSLNDDSVKNFAAALAKITGHFTTRSPLFKKDRKHLKKAKRLGLCCGENSKICKNLETAGGNR